MGKGAGAESSRVRLEDLLCHMAYVSGFMVMGLASGLSLASHSDSGSFLVALLLSQDRCQRDSRRWLDTLDHESLTFTGLFQLLLNVVPCSYQDLLS